MIPTHKNKFSVDGELLLCFFPQSQVKFWVMWKIHAFQVSMEGFIYLSKMGF
jgi:hypothetical protein